MKFKGKTKKEIQIILKVLEREYPNACCSLNYSSPIELVVALILAAQCTDERVNKVVPILFGKFQDVYVLCKANLEDVIEIIKSCGFYKTKANNILLTCNIIVNNFSGNVPNTMKDLLTLAGIGRKSANIILQECFSKIEGIAVDTHVTRLSRKIGLSNKKNAVEIEQDLMKKIDKKYFNKINHLFVFHGRAICIARKPLCNICPIFDICSKNE